MQHLAIIMDGIRRWAKKNKLASIMGHEKGFGTIETAIDFCIKSNIKYLSIYAFSLENFNRSEEEKKYLQNLFKKHIKKELVKFIKNGIRIRFVGDSNYFPKDLVSLIEDAEEKTKHLDKLNFNILFCYGSRQEVVDATKKIAQSVKDGLLDVDEINEKKLEDNLWTKGIPNPDLILRTGGDLRLSNFLLFQAAYSELEFLDCFWPEITNEHLQKCLDKFKKKKRNFGV